MKRKKNEEKYNGDDGDTTVNVDVVGVENKESEERERDEYNFF